MKPSTKRILKSTGIALIALLLWAFALFLIADTLVTPWLPVGVGFTVAVLTLPIALKSLRRCDDGTSGKMVFVTKTVVYVAAAIPLGICLMLGVNKYIAPSDPAEVTASITSKYAKEQNEYRTVGRRRVYQGKSNRYYVVVTMPTGRSKVINVTASQYVAFRAGQQVGVTIRRGCLGYDVIEQVSLAKKREGSGRSEGRLP